MTIDATASLLERVFPDAPRISGRRYLHWLYEASPFGPVIQANLDDPGGRAGHYALVPVALTDGGAPFEGALSLNTAVAERARGGGVFVKLATEAIDEAERRGVRLVIGVANANSTPGFVRRLSFELAGPLPATVLVPIPGARQGVRSCWAGEDVFAPGGVLADGLETLLSPLRSAWHVSGRWNHCAGDLPRPVLVTRCTVPSGCS